MFLTYLRRELRRRSRQAFVIMLGIGIGIGLVVAVSSTSAGVKNAQKKVLQSLYGVGTDITVSQSATGGFGPQTFRFGQGNQSNLTPGSTFSRTTLRPAAGSGTLDSSKVAGVAHLKDVAAATGGLSLNETSVSGTYEGSSGASGFGGGTSGGQPPISVSSRSVTGVEPTATGLGPLSPDEISSGRYFTSIENSPSSNVAIVSSSYAKQDNLKVGSSVTVNGTSLKVIGLATGSSVTSDVYLPLQEAQHLAGLSGKVTDVYVSVASSSDVSKVQGEIKGLLPHATVTTSASLANEVTGSLSSASNLTTNLGKWLSIVALLVAFLVAALLMVAAVSRRTSEFGTLKALGWRTRRVVGQVMGEGLVQGIAGGIIGVVLGVVASEVISLVAPSLSATVSPTAFTAGGAPGSGTPGGSFFGAGRFAGSGGGGFAGPGGRGGGGFARPGGFASRFADLSHTVAVHLAAPIQGSTLGLAIGLAVLGGIIAGVFGAWRAGRLRPAAALRRVE